MKNALHDPIWFTPPDGSSRVLWKDSPSPPPSPDYRGAAQDTAAGNLEAAQYATKANRVNQFSPYGSTTYSQADPNDPNSQWSQQINLSPTGSSLLDSLNQSQLGIAGLQAGATQNVQNMMSTPFGQGGGGMGNLGPAQDRWAMGDDQRREYNLSRDAQRGGGMGGYSGFPALPTADTAARQHSEDSAYQAATSRLDPQWNQRQAAMETQLRNQGLAPGGEAYTNAARDFNFGRNDAYQQAQANAVNQGLTNQQAQFNMGLAANQTGLQEAMALRNQPLNELNALRSSSQVSNPQFGNIPQQQTTAGPNMMGAAQAQSGYDMGLFNQQAQNANAFNSGLFSLGSAFMGMR